MDSRSRCVQDVIPVATAKCRLQFKHAENFLKKIPCESKTTFYSMISLEFQYETRCGPPFFGGVRLRLWRNIRGNFRGNWDMHCVFGMQAFPSECLYCCDAISAVNRIALRGASTHFRDVLYLRSPLIGDFATDDRRPSPQKGCRMG